MQEWITAFGEEIKKRGIKPEEGLGTELFQFISSLTPIINVDLLITNDRGEVLLSWRDDEYCGRGWHIPGGCVRLLETLDNRIHLTALGELGFDVEYDPHPVKISEDIAGRRITEYPNMERAHFISLLYHCRPKDASLGDFCAKGISITNTGIRDDGLGYAAQNDICLTDSNMQKDGHVTNIHFVDYCTGEPDITEVKDCKNNPEQWRWFHEVPDDFLAVQAFYKSYLLEIFKKGNPLSESYKRNQPRE